MAEAAGFSNPSSTPAVMGILKWFRDQIERLKREQMLRELELLRYQLELDAEEAEAREAKDERKKRKSTPKPPAEDVVTSEEPWKADHRRKAHRVRPLEKRDGRRRATSQDGSVKDYRDYTTGFLSRNADLTNLATDEDQLRRYGLPIWRSEAGLCDELGLDFSELRYFATHRRTDRVFHYVCFTINKRKGGKRLIMAPKRKLKELQRRIAVFVVNRLPLSDHAHGFRQGRSIRSAAEPHVGKRVVVKMDIKDFFPSVHFGRVRGLFIAYGYSFKIATTLALLLTESERQPVELDGELRYVPVGPRVTVQGAPTSPGLCNAICLKLDRRLGGLAKSVGFTYTRYADDLTFSGDDPSLVSKVVALTRTIAAEEGFRIHPEKTRVLRRGGRQHVVGVVVNEVAGRSRKERRRLRAAIHRLTQTPPVERDPAKIRSIKGSLAFLHMLNPDAAVPLRAQFSRLESP